MGIAKSIMEHEQTECVDCETPCKATSELVTECMDKKHGTGYYHQNHLRAVRQWSKVK